MSSLQLTIRSEDPWFIAQEIFDILNEFLQPASTLSLTAAAQRIDSLFPTKRTDPGEKEEAGSFLWELWDVYDYVAEQLPHNHPAQDKLAKLLQVLRDLPSETILDTWTLETRLWRDLPYFRPVLVEEFHRYGFDTLPSADSSEIVQWQRWRNLNAFGARLTRDGTSDFQVYGLLALSAALEDQPDPRARAFHTQGPVLDCNVPIAAQWIVHCGHVLLESTQEFETWGTGGNLWKGKAGFCQERWQLWKQRFGEMREHDQVSEETKEVARDAYNLMVKYENDLRDRDEVAQTSV